MTAHTVRYFHPTPLSQNTDGGAANKDINVKVMAAQFRGRGLICVADSLDEKNEINGSHERLSTLPGGMIGVALAPSSLSHAKNGDDYNSRSFKVVETFSQIYNWQHEHDVDKVKRSISEGGSEKAGLKAVLGWCELSHAVSSSAALFLICH